jgi:hypothetical protein
MQATKLITRIKGGLGNQLFCYASARRLALVSKAELVIDDVSGFAYDKKYKRSYALDVFNIQTRKAEPSERFFPLERICRAIIKRISQYFPLAERRYIFQNSVKFSPELLELRLQSGMTYFDGFGQSERYFADVEEVIRADLKIAPPSDEFNQEMAKKIRSSEAVALHVRWFDSHHAELHNNISIEYYSKAIEKILKETNQPHFFIFSDNADATKDKLESIMAGLNKTFVNHNKTEAMAYADMWLMSLCKHFVIANSTFGWWAAWLGEEKGISKVIVPALEIPASNNITAWGFEGLIPERWTLL